MSSKDLKPKIRLGQSVSGRRKAMIVWIFIALTGGAGAYAAYRYTGTTTVEVPVAKVRKGEFIISVKTRGEVRSTRSVVIAAPQVPDPRIVTLADTGKPIHRGDVVVEFDAAQQEQYYLSFATS